MLVSELKTGLKRFGFDDKDPLLVWLNAGMHEIEEEYPNWSWLKKVQTINALANVSTLVTAGSIQRVIKLRDVTPGREGRDLEYWDERKFDREIDNPALQGNPEIFTIRGSSQLEVYPVPTAATTYKLRFIEALADLVADEETPVLPTKNHYLIVLGGAYIALQAENEEDRAANAQAQFESKLAKMVAADMKRQTGQAGSAEDVMHYAH